MDRLWRSFGIAVTKRSEAKCKSSCPIGADNNNRQGRKMKICFFGMDNLPVLAPEFSSHGVGGEQVQQTLLARSLAKLGHQVSMIVYDYGQPDRQEWDGIMTHRAFRPDAGIPILRFVHPRWTNTWKALRKADADVYYVSCAGMQLGLVAMFCSRYGRKFIFRVAHDTDCQPDALLIKYWRDKKLYEYGLRRAHLILVQSVKQQQSLLANYRLQSTIAKMLVQEPTESPDIDVDVLWVNNLRDFKRPDLFIELANRLPHLSFCMIGGQQQGHSELYKEIKTRAEKMPNVRFLGRVPYQKMPGYYARARVFVNTSDSEGFPNSYLQAWIHGTPTVAFFDPDRVIRTHELGYSVSSLDEMVEAVSTLALNRQVREEFSARCARYMSETYAETQVLATYLKGMKEILNG
jgi:glycosyltransferase involved in cell wall biosynthesis